MNNLDEILKQQMQDFAPDAPNVWAGIEQGVQANAAAQSGAGAGKVVLSKAALTAFKVAAILVIPASVATYFYSKNSEISKTENVTKVIEAKEPIISNEPTISLEKTLVTNNSKENITNDKKDVSYTFTTTQKVAIANNINTEKETIETNHQEVFRQPNPEKTEILQGDNKVSSKPILYEIDLSDKIDSIENTENNFEATEISKTELAFIKIPNVLTPNNDGFNDRYVIEIENEKLYNLKIYNYNNELVFESNDKNFTWDGENQKTGQACNSGIYYGVLNFKFSNSDKVQTKMTKIKLIR